MTNEKQVSRSVHYKTYKEWMSAYNWIKIHFRPQSEVFKTALNDGLKRILSNT